MLSAAVLVIVLEKPCAPEFLAGSITITHTSTSMTPVKRHAGITYFKILAYIDGQLWKQGILN